MIYLTRKLYFCAAHRLCDDSLSPEENRERFGNCMNLHGHNYVLEVTVAGDVDANTGMVIHLSDLDTIVRERVIDHLDHKNLNEDVEEFKRVPPTAEIIARYIWNRLDGAFGRARLHRVRVHEDHVSYADYYGEGR
jgi:6-pyruvoyltetrahydropterin/6-carboxytetrahydropterin synthase